MVFPTFIFQNPYRYLTAGLFQFLDALTGDLVVRVL